MIEPDGICVDSDPTNDTLDCDQGDGPAYFNFTRTLTAQVLSDWLATDPTGSGDPDVLVLGDLNAYDKEDPIVRPGDERIHGSRGSLRGRSAYSYVFDGQIGYLDYGMANAASAAGSDGCDGVAPELRRAGHLGLRHVVQE